MGTGGELLLRDLIVCGVHYYAESAATINDSPPKHAVGALHNHDSARILPGEFSCLLQRLPWRSSDRRRERVLPLWKETAAALNAWLKVRQVRDAEEMFHNAGGRAMTRAGFEYILDKDVGTARQKQPSITKKRVTPHVLRHTCAMHILQATGDIRKVSLWLGHASIQSTEIYLRADPTEKLDALAMGIPPTLKRGKFQVPDKLMAMFKEVGKAG